MKSLKFLLTAHLVLFIHFGSFAQGLEHYIGISISPSSTFRNLSNNSENSMIYEIHQKSDEWFFGGSVGFSALWDLHEYIKLQTDLQYSVFTHKIEQTLFSMDPQNGFLLPGIDARSVFERHVISVPISVNFHLNSPTDKWSFFLSAGGGFEVFVADYLNSNANSEHDSGIRPFREKQNYEDNNPNRSIAGFAQAGFGVDWNPSGSFKMRFATMYRQIVTNIMQDEIVYKKYPFAVGFVVGAYWRL